MKIDRITDDDIRKLVRLEERAFTVGPYSVDMLRYALSESGDMAFKVEDEKEIIAYIMACPLSESSLDIESIAVDPEHRGKGLAKALFQHIEDIAKQRGYEKIVLEVREHNREAIGLYEKLGFKKTEFLKNYYSEKLNGSRNAFRMEKHLIQ
jgi:ribosomal-protein-alanine N-acetyltransferase